MARSRKSRRPALQLLDQAAVPIYVLDASRQIAYCNPACATWLGEDSAALMGRRCDYHSIATPPSDPLAAGLCPPPNAFLGQRCRAPVVAWRETGTAPARLAEFIPLSTDANAPGGILAVVTTESGGEAMPTPTDLPDAQQLHAELRDLHDQLARAYDAERLVGASAAIERVRGQIQLAASTAARVVILGPVGSGRERVARTIHAKQMAASWPYLVPLACPLLDAELLESTVEAFLRSCAELSDERPATLLLLEVDQLPEDAQASLLGFLRISEIRLNTLATARESLLVLSEQGGFRSELAHALSTLVIEIPPLSKRMVDVPLLVQAAIEQLNALGGRQIAGVTETAMTLLLRYAWPGNADELFQLIAEACDAAQGDHITDQDLPERIHVSLTAAKYPRREERSIQLDQVLTDVERELIQRSLRAAKGNKAQAARLLGLSRSRLLRRMEVLQIS
jgi:DNA-binding NtrC family response regulator